MQLTAADRDLVTRAVVAAEQGTDGEIVTIVAPRSDAYHDVALHWGVLAMLLALAVLAALPRVAAWLHGFIADPWSDAPAPDALFMLALVLVTVVFLAMRVLLAWWPLRLALTPRATKARRVRARALTLFRAAAERRTRRRVGVLLYLSLAEHRAEIIADAAVHDLVEPGVWGEAMAALVVAVKDGRAAEGMAAAVDRIGAVLAEHVPGTEMDVNELPDRLIEL